MGQKTHPIAFRLADNKAKIDWPSQWFASAAQYPKTLLEDWKIRSFLEKRLAAAGLMLVKIERLTAKMRITLFVSRPGLVIGRGGKGLEELKRQLCGLIILKDSEKNLEIEVEEVKNPDLSAQLVAQRIAFQLERRMPYRRVVNKTIERVMASGAKGVRVILKGRIGGIEIARREKFSLGEVSLSTIRANIDYAEVPSLTKSGYVGVKVYINRGEN